MPLQLERLDNRLVPTAINPVYWEAGAFESLGYVGSGPRRSAGMAQSHSSGVNSRTRIPDLSLPAFCLSCSA